MGGNELDHCSCIMEGIVRVPPVPGSLPPPSLFCLQKLWMSGLLPPSFGHLGHPGLKQSPVAKRRWSWECACVCVYMQVRWDFILPHPNFQCKYYKSMKCISKIEELISSCWGTYMRGASKTVLMLSGSGIAQKTFPGLGDGEECRKHFNLKLQAWNCFH